MTEPRDPDPLKLYTVVRRSLNLTAGKVGGQCQHAMDYLSREVFRLMDPDRDPISEDVQARLEDFRAWQGSKDHAKIILGATDEEFEQVKRENPRHFLVIDLGYTQVAPNTETCLALWPMRMSARSPILKKLRPL